MDVDSYVDLKESYKEEQAKKNAKWTRTAINLCILWFCLIFHY